MGEKVVAIKIRNQIMSRVLTLWLKKFVDLHLALKFTLEVCGLIRYKGRWRK